MADVEPRRLLLDTHIFLWWQEASTRLAHPIAREIADAQQVYVSLVTAWELAIKRAAGKLHSRESFAEAVQANQFGLLPVTLEHVDAVAALPLSGRHRDPFDRMLIAQALHEHMTVVTHDSAFRAYSVPILWA